MTKINETQRYIKRIAMYALMGPLIGLLLIDAALIAHWVFEALRLNKPLYRDLQDFKDSIALFLIFNLYGVIFAYIIGVLPAILTGACAARFHTYKSEAICATLVGATPFIIIYIVTSIVENTPIVAVDNAYLSLIALAVIGAISGLVCAGLKRPEKAAHTGMDELTLGQQFQTNK